MSAKEAGAAQDPASRTLQDSGLEEGPQALP